MNIAYMLCKTCGKAPYSFCCYFVVVVVVVGGGGGGVVDSGLFNIQYSSNVTETTYCTNFGFSPQFYTGVTDVSDG